MLRCDTNSLTKCPDEIVGNGTDTNCFLFHLIAYVDDFVTTET